MNAFIDLPDDDDYIALYDEDDFSDWPVYRIFHGMDNVDLGVFVVPNEGAPDTRRAALYCQFMAEEWFGVEVMVSNLGIAALLVQFYDHQQAPRVWNCPLAVDLYIDRENACGAECVELMADPSLARPGLKRALYPFLHGVFEKPPMPADDE